MKKNDVCDTTKNIEKEKKIWNIFVLLNKTMLNWFFCWEHVADLKEKLLNCYYIEIIKHFFLEIVFLIWDCYTIITSYKKSVRLKTFYLFFKSKLEESWSKCYSKITFDMILLEIFILFFELWLEESWSKYCSKTTFNIIWLEVFF